MTALRLRVWRASPPRSDVRLPWMWRVYRPRARSWSLPCGVAYSHGEALAVGHAALERARAAEPRS